MAEFHDKQYLADIMEEQRKVKEEALSGRKPERLQAGSDTETRLGRVEDKMESFQNQLNKSDQTMVLFQQQMKQQLSALTEMFQSSLKQKSILG
ncbi:hypothetical protein PSY31_22600, partial [Shigella flexneri]|nr:hypothetical protein [Shigella flexneri]